MKSITIKNVLNDYNVIIGCDTISYFLNNFNFPSKVLIITTRDLYNKYLNNDHKFKYYFLDDGETAKSINTYLEISELLIKEEFSKSDLIIGFGGGVILDLAGFLSATYKRGINYIMIPTTLLAMVDASIGGKNGINYLGIKNMLGTYYMPNMIIDDLNVLSSLSDTEYASGLMESLKMGIIDSKELYNIIKDNDLSKIRNNIFLEEEIIELSINIKKKVVESDPFEEDYRRILNLGHTIGHAIEALNLCNITHGEAIALGMLPFVSKEIKEDLIKIINKYFNKTNLDLDNDKLISLIREDKKNKNDVINIVDAKDFNDIEIKEITKKELEEKINEINIW